MTPEKNTEPRKLQLTNAQFEHTLGILAEVDLTPLANALEGNLGLVDILKAFPMLGQVRELQIFRRLEAVWTAKPEDLDEAEIDAPKMKRMETVAAHVPVDQTMAGLSDFFDGLGLSQSGTHGFLEAQKMMKAMLGQMDPEMPSGDSPSED